MSEMRTSLQRRCRVMLAGVALALLASAGARAEVTVLGWPGGPEETALRAAAKAYNERAGLA